MYKLKSIFCLFLMFNTVLLRGLSNSSFLNMGKGYIDKQNVKHNEYFDISFRYNLFDWNGIYPINTHRLITKKWLNEIKKIKFPGYSNKSRWQEVVKYIPHPTLDLVLIRVAQPIEKKILSMFDLDFSKKTPQEESWLLISNVCFDFYRHQGVLNTSVNDLHINSVQSAFGQLFAKVDNYFILNKGEPINFYRWAYPTIFGKNNTLEENVKINPFTIEGENLIKERSIEEGLSDTENYYKQIFDKNKKIINHHYKLKENFNGVADIVDEGGGIFNILFTQEGTKLSLVGLTSNKVEGLQNNFIKGESSVGINLTTEKIKKWIAQTVDTCEKDLKISSEVDSSIEIRTIVSSKAVALTPNLILADYCKDDLTSDGKYVYIKINHHLHCLKKISKVLKNLIIYELEEPLSEKYSVNYYPLNRQSYDSTQHHIKSVDKEEIGFCMFLENKNNNNTSFIINTDELDETQKFAIYKVGSQNLNSRSTAIIDYKVLSLVLDQEQN